VSEGKQLQNIFVTDVYGCRQRRDDLSFQCNEKPASAERNEHTSPNSRLRLHSPVSVVAASEISRNQIKKEIARCNR